MSNFLRGPYGPAGVPDFAPGPGRADFITQGHTPLTRPQPTNMGYRGVPQEQGVPSFIRSRRSPTPGGPKPETPSQSHSDVAPPIGDPVDTTAAVVKASADGGPSEADRALWGPIKGDDGGFYPGKIQPNEEPTGTPDRPADSPPPAESWFAPTRRTQGDPVHPEPDSAPAQPTFEPEANMLRKVELFTRVGQVVNFVNGAAAGRAQAQNQDSLTAPTPPPIPSEERVSNPPMFSQTVELLITRPRIVGRAKAPEDSQATPPGVASVPAPMPERPVRAPHTQVGPPEPGAPPVPDGPDYFSSPHSDDALERIIAGIARAKGQADPELRESVTVEVSDADVVAAGGDRAAATANKIEMLRREEGLRGQGGQ